MSVHMVLAFSLAALACSRGESAKVPAIFVFGDSTADVGNNNYLPGTAPKANFPHSGVDYPGGIPTGRFSNGYNGIDYLAMMLGFKQSPPPFLSLKNDTHMLHGVNFASGSSGILDSTGSAIALSTQVSYFKSITGILTKALDKSAAPLFLSKSLFIFSTGSNDLFAYYAQFGARNSTANRQFIALLVAKLADHLTALYELGARKFGVFGASHVGCVPYIRSFTASGGCAAELNSLARRFNSAAKAELHQLSKRLEGMEYSYCHAYDLVSMVLSMPQHFGYREYRIACCGSGRFNGASACTPNTTICSNRKEYFFWDWFHPTEVTYKLVVLKAYNGTRQFASPVNMKELAEC